MLVTVCPVAEGAAAESPEVPSNVDFVPLTPALARVPSGLAGVGIPGEPARVLPVIVAADTVIPATTDVATMDVIVLSDDTESVASTHSWSSQPV